MNAAAACQQMGSFKCAFNCLHNQMMVVQDGAFTIVFQSCCTFIVTWLIGTKQLKHICLFLTGIWREAGQVQAQSILAKHGKTKVPSTALPGRGEGGGSVRHRICFCENLRAFLRSINEHMIYWLQSPGPQHGARGCHGAQAVLAPKPVEQRLCFAHPKPRKRDEENTAAPRRPTQPMAQ